MPTISEGIYEVIFRQTYLGENIFNVFHYKHTLDLDDKQEECANAFNEDLVPALKLIQSDGVAYNNIKAKNLTGNLADFSLTPTDTQGTLAGADLASLVAASFILNRETKDTRNGWKRFTGMLEENSTDKTWLAAFVTACNTFAGVLGTNISTAGGIFEPVILRKPIPGSGIATYNTIASAQFRNRVTTQNSRKPW